MIELDENTTIIQSKGLKTVTLNEDLHRCKLLACCVGMNGLCWTALDGRIK